AALASFAALPGLAPLDVDALPRLRAYPSYVSALDADGNEVAGIRVPDISVAVATHTGWSPRHAHTGGGGQFLDMMGTSLPFAATRSERAGADPRPSIDERYRDRDAYASQARAAAESLAAARYILREDVDLAVELAT